MPKQNLENRFDCRKIVFMWVCVNLMAASGDVSAGTFTLLEYPARSCQRIAFIIELG